MAKLTQRELLEEGVGSSIWSGVKRAGRLADYAVQKIAPEARQLYKTPWDVGKGAVDILRGSDTKKGKELDEALIRSMQKGLATEGYEMAPNELPRFQGTYNGDEIFKVKVIDKAGRISDKLINHKGITPKGLPPSIGSHAVEQQQTSQPKQATKKPAVATPPTFTFNPTQTANTGSQQTVNIPSPQQVIK